ncbi:hypothetical protein LUZ63_007276 [Rhynchospora breviuscula]|uniref:Glycosyltransferase 61 catalytic domain-containing protein n=1 Tax=Rhynchospora breviuscula TaxID=2022672 RepID=A0A9Q0CSK9_9POAL|nr:hypothetical protein LUZ63_007276 [Rhynchospora breviuscula]
MQTSSVLEDDHIVSESTAKESMKNKTSKASTSSPILSCNLKGFRSDVCEIYSKVRIHVGEELGFEVVVNNTSSHDVEEFAKTVNSFDVMMGVHGAGLTNEVFLPTNAVLIQIVPFGNLEGMSENDFGKGARNMMLKYLQYSIIEEESTLIDLYPRDHAVFRDPESIHRQGWAAMGEIYLNQQNVKLNITRFKPVLARALELLS